MCRLAECRDNHNSVLSWLESDELLRVRRSVLYHDVWLIHLHRRTKQQAIISIAHYCLSNATYSNNSIPTTFIFIMYHVPSHRHWSAPFKRGIIDTGHWRRNNTQNTNHHRSMQLANQPRQAVLNVQINCYCYRKREVYSVVVEIINTGQY